jgi:hypothetical protein
VGVAACLAVAAAGCTGGSGPDPEPPPGNGAAHPTGDPTPAPRYTFTPTPAPPRDAPAPLDQPVELGTGGDDLVVTLTGTAFDPEFVTPERTFWMYLSIENRGKEPWRSRPATAVLRDELGGRFRADPRPTPAELVSDARSFGFRDADLSRPISVRPGETLEGVLLFHVPGAPREVVLDADLGLGVRAEFVTNFGLF